MNFKHKFCDGAQTMVAVIIATVLMTACSGGGGNSGSSSGSTSGTVGSTLAVFAGNMGGSGNLNGTGALARFYSPSGVAADSAGNIYVADTLNQTIRKITPAGVVTTLAGTSGAIGSIDGTGAAARFNKPNGVATDGAGNVYVADIFNHIIRKITPTGVVTTLAGAAGVRGSADGAGVAASFTYPSGVATDNAGNVYVADGNNIIRRITPVGVVTTLAGTAGVYGSTDGNGAAASFRNLTGITADVAGNIYVADDGNNDIRKVTPTGVVTTLAGTAGAYGSADGSGAAASFVFPMGVATDSVGNLYVADNGNNTIRKITPAGVVTTLAGMAGVFGNTDGTGVAASFAHPSGVVADSVGNVYVADTVKNSIRKITPAGVVTTLAGIAGIYGSADGARAVASFAYPSGVATDSADNVYVADTLNNIIRKITPAGVVNTLAGTTGIYGSVDGTGAAASFGGPPVWLSSGIQQIGLSGIATDHAGNVYVADTYNSTIRKITPDGVVTTLAGKAGVRGSADGTGAAASFAYPSGVATDRAGNVYVTDTVNNTIRKITPAGAVTTLAGTAGVIGSADGTGTAASFGFGGPLGPLAPAGRDYFVLSGIAADDGGNVYVADTNNNAIRKVTPAGVVTTVVGLSGQVGFIAGALPGGLSHPLGVAISGTSLYITTENGVAVVSNVP